MLRSPWLQRSRSVNHLSSLSRRRTSLSLQGKTSLFKLIVGEEKVSSGSISINGQIIDEGFLRSSPSEIGYCPQYDCANNYLSVEEILYLFARLRAILPEDLQATVQSLAHLFLLEGFLQDNLSNLSGGTRRRTHAALACLGPPAILLLGKTHSVLSSIPSPFNSSF